MPIIRNPLLPCLIADNLHSLARPSYLCNVITEKAKCLTNK
nr:MAG TPA: hypothetical protein [Caudoviricetes sp.]